MSYKYYIKNNEDDFIVGNTKENIRSGYNVVSREVDKYNKYDLEEVKKYASEHPEFEVVIDDTKYLVNEIRALRDEKIKAVEWRVSRNSQEIALGMTPTEEITPVLEYIQALRDIPQQEGFPNDVIFPEEV